MDLTPTPASRASDEEEDFVMLLVSVKLIMPISHRDDVALHEFRSIFLYSAPETVFKFEWYK